MDRSLRSGRNPDRRLLQRIDASAGVDPGPGPRLQPRDEPRGLPRDGERPPGEHLGPPAQDGFAKRPVDNVGVQYGLEALNLPLGNTGKITMAQFLDLNLKIGGVDIDGVPITSRTRTDPDVSRIAYRSGNINDGRGLARAAIINFAAPQNIEIHTPYTRTRSRRAWPRSATRTTTRSGTTVRRGRRSRRWTRG